MAESQGKRNFNRAGTGASSPRSERPSTLHNVLLKVESYDGDKVKGTDLRTGKPLEVALLSPDRAANMSSKYPDAAYWEERFSKRPTIAELSDTEEKAFTPPGGVIQFSNVRLDFSDKNYYAERGFGVLRNPAAQEVVLGTVAIDEFDNDSVRVQVYDQKEIINLSDNDALANREAIKKAFAPRAPNGMSGEMPRIGVLTTSYKDEFGKYAFSVGYPRSASTAIEGSNGYDLSDGFSDTLNKTTLDKKNGPAFAMIAALCDLPFDHVAARVADGDEEVIEALQKDYEFAKSGQAQISLLPGYTVPMFDSSVDALRRSGMAKAGTVEGGVVVTHRRADGEEYSRPVGSVVVSFYGFSQNQKRPIGFVANSAHRKMFGISFDEPKPNAEQEQEQQAAPAPASVKAPAPAPSF